MHLNEVFDVNSELVSGRIGEGGNFLASSFVSRWPQQTWPNESPSLKMLGTWA